MDVPAELKTLQNVHVIDVHRVMRAALAVGTNNNVDGVRALLKCVTHRQQLMGACMIADVSADRPLMLLV